MTKLIIQIPCFNEAETLASTMSALPRAVPGVERVEWLIIDDGSDDRTAEIAWENGADHVLRLKRNIGLAKAFAAGLRESIRLGADVIVNTDADNQYDASGIADLVAPILSQTCDVSVGARPNQLNPEFSRTKKALQKFGSKVISKLAGLQIDDAASGFRAYSREAAMQTRVFSDFSYTMETLIQYGHSGLSVQNVPISVNPSTRPSRLFKSIPNYVLRSGMTAIRSYLVYSPFKFLGRFALLFGSLGLFLVTIWALKNLPFGNQGRNVGLLVVGATSLLIGIQFLVFAFLSELLCFSRKNAEYLNSSDSSR